MEDKNLMETQDSSTGSKDDVKSDVVHRQEIAVGAGQGLYLNHNVLLHKLVAQSVPIF